MRNKLRNFKKDLLNSLVIVFTFSFLFGCASSSNLSMDSIGATNKPLKKVIIASRSFMSLKYREQHQGVFISTVQNVLEKNNIEWIYSSPRDLLYAHKRKNLSHSLLITTKNQQHYYRGATRILSGFTIKLVLTDLKERSQVWEGEFINSDVINGGKNDREKMERLVTDHFVQAGIIPAPEVTENKAG